MNEHCFSFSDGCTSPCNVCRRSVIRWILRQSRSNPRLCSICPTATGFSRLHFLYFTLRLNSRSNLSKLPVFHKRIVICSCNREQAAAAYYQQQAATATAAAQQPPQQPNYPQQAFNPQQPPAYNPQPNYSQYAPMSRQQQ